MWNTTKRIAGTVFDFLAGLLVIGVLSGIVIVVYEAVKNHSPPPRFTLEHCHAKGGIGFLDQFGRLYECRIPPQ